MSGLTSQQRKLAYLGGLLILLVPIIAFGLPSDGSKPKAPGQAASGGLLAQLRQKYDLGESNLGDVDPSSVTMNLVLLGLRGIAVNQLWIQMDKAKNEKDWPQMLEATQSIVKLQPHYEKVWDFNGWNLAWNTSVEWDAVPDRYYWVKRGGKFLMEGVSRNEKSTELRYDLAKIYQQKLGVADESMYFRRYFLSDPDTETWQGGPDTQFHRGPEGEYPEPKDSYLVAFDWYKAAVKNESDWKVPLLKGTLDRTAFHALPARCKFEYAGALHKDGQFGEVAREAWADALDEWINKFGAEELFSPYGTDGKIVRYKLEATTDEDIRALADSPEEEQRVRAAIDSFHKIVNYRYWRTRGMSEAEPETSKAHQDFYEAGQKFKEQDWREAKTMVESAMKGLENVISRYPDLRYEDNMIEECMLAVRMWQDIYRLELPDEKPPAEFPLRTLWQEQQGRMQEIDREFRLRFLTQVEQ